MRILAGAWNTAPHIICTSSTHHFICVSRHPHISLNVYGWVAFVPIGPPVEGDRFRIFVRAGTGGSQGFLGPFGCTTASAIILNCQFLQFAPSFFILACLLYLAFSFAINWSPPVNNHIFLARPLKFLPVRKLVPTGENAAARGSQILVRKLVPTSFLLPLNT